MNDVNDIKKCPYSGKCGGCSYTGIPYEEQLAKKQNRVKELFSKAGIKPEEGIGTIVGADVPYYYRNKVHSVFSRDRKGRIIRGMYREESHDVVDVSGCLLEDMTADRIIAEIRELAVSFKMKIYDEDRRDGFLRHVLVRSASYHGKRAYMVVLVTGEVQFTGKNNFIRALREKFPDIVTIVQNINDKRTGMVLGQRNIVLYGRGYVIDDSLGLQFRISPSSFFQINTEQTVKLYGLVREMACPDKNDTILDAYCGTGTIGMFLAPYAKHVTGIELNPDAVKDAVSNSRDNDISNIGFQRADATEYMKRLAASGREVARPDILCMDPPRSGSTPEFINAAAAAGITRIVYVSCEPETLVRDLKVFSKKGYRIISAVPVDMFPQTGKTEVVVKLERGKAK